LGIRVEDSEKRDLYTLSDVVTVLEAKLGLGAETTADVAIIYAS
jgi:hypothetical protein